MSVDLKTIVDFCRRKGFVYPGSEIYGGLANTWDFGPKGTLLKNNIKAAWREFFVTSREDMVEIDGGIFMNQKVWEASGHTATFADCLVDDKKTKHRFRADHLIEDQLGIDVEGKTAVEITEIIRSNALKNPHTGEVGDWSEAKYMNLMFETNRDKTALTAILDVLEKADLDGDKLSIEDKNVLQELKRAVDNLNDNRIYLRPETAQAIFINFKNVVSSERRKLPFGIGQIGKAFRNEITPGNFVFRVVELEQMEIEYFISPKDDSEQIFNNWIEAQERFLREKMGFDSENFRRYQHSEEKLSHYSKKTIDIEYRFPFGFSELTGLAYRTDFDLKQHQTHSKQSLEYQDPETNEKYIPHCLEPTVGVERLFLASLCEAYTEEELEGGDKRVVFKFPENLAPYKYSVLPLMKKDGLREKAQEVYTKLREMGISVNYDEAGSVGKRYRREDENGTPKCITIDYETMEDGTVTIRDRDTMEQVRVDLDKFFEDL